MISEHVELLKTELRSSNVWWASVGWKKDNTFLETLTALIEYSAKSHPEEPHFTQMSLRLLEPAAKIDSNKLRTFWPKLLAAVKAQDGRALPFCASHPHLEVFFSCSSAPAKPRSREGVDFAVQLLDNGTPLWERPTSGRWINFLSEVAPRANRRVLPLLLGRDTERVELIEELRQTGARLAILGEVGIGKTLLADTMLQDPRCEERYGNHVHVVNCSSVETAAAAGELAGRSVNLPIAEHRVLDLLRVVKQRNLPILFLFDGIDPLLSEIEVLFNLINAVAAAGATVIMTIDGNTLPRAAETSGWHTHVLGPVAETAAREICLDVAGNGFSSHPSFRRVLDLGSGNPLFLKALTREVAGVSEVIAKQRLKDLVERTGSGLTAYRLLLNQRITSRTLSPRAREVLAVLSLLKNGVSEETAVRVLDSQTGGEAVSSLLHHQLVTVENGRLMTRPLDRAVFRAELQPNRDMLQRTLGYLEDVLDELNSAWGSSTWHLTTQRLEPDIVGIEDLLEHALRSDLWQSAVAVVRALTKFFYYQPALKPIRLLERALDVAAAQSEDKLTSVIEETLGVALLQQSQYREADRFLTQAYDRLAATDPDQAIHVLSRQAQLAFYSSQYVRSISAATDVLNDPNPAVYPRLIALLARAKAYHETSMYAEALRDIEAYVRIGMSHEKHQLLATHAEYTRAEIRLDLRSNAPSLGEIFELQKRYRSIGDTLGELNSIRLHAEYALLTGDTRTAESLLADPSVSIAGESVLTKFRLIGELLGVGDCLRRLGDVQLSKRELAVAEGRYQESIDVFSSLPNHLGVAKGQLGLARVALLRWQLPEAERLLESARAMFALIGNQHGQLLSLILTATVKRVSAIAMIGGAVISHDEISRVVQDAVTIARTYGSPYWVNLAIHVGPSEEYSGSAPALRRDGRAELVADVCWY